MPFVGAGTLVGVWLRFAGADVCEEVVADDILGDSEKYEFVSVLEAIGDDVKLEGLEGKGVEGGDDRTTWELEPGTLTAIGLELAGEFADAEKFVLDASLGRDDGRSVGIGAGCCVGCGA